MHSTSSAPPRWSARSLHSGHSATVAVAEMFVKIFETTPQYGLVNALLASLGLDCLVGPWLSHGDTAFWIIVLMDVWRAIGFYAILLYAGVIDIPSELIDAARIDGANAGGSPATSSCRCWHPLS